MFEVNESQFENSLCFQKFKRTRALSITNGWHAHFLCVWVRWSFWVRPPLWLWTQIEPDVNGNFVFDTKTPQSSSLVVDNYSCLRLCYRTRPVHIVWCFHGYVNLDLCTLSWGTWTAFEFSLTAVVGYVIHRNFLPCFTRLVQGSSKKPSVERLLKQVTNLLLSHHHNLWETCVHLCCWLCANLHNRFRINKSTAISLSLHWLKSI